MGSKRETPTNNATPKPRRNPGGGGAVAPTNRAAGNPSYAGYEYQISVTIWVALDLMLAKGAAETLIIEPRSHEDIEAAAVDPDKASLGIVTEAIRFEVVIQAKSRSTEPWTTAAFADVLTGKQDGDGGSGPVARARPLAMLAADSSRRYVFITNESLQGALRPHSGEHLLDFPEVKTLPPYARADYDAAAQASIAPRLLLCPGLTVEVLDGRIARLLALHGHVPTAAHEACVRDMRDAVRRRITGFAEGRWTKADLLAVLVKHGGSVLPSRAMDHYVRPRSYEAIRRTLDDRHAVVIAGPSGTGKSLTADFIELELRRSEVPFAVVGEEHGPGHVRSHLARADSVLFHLRDPWGGNRLTPGANRWSDELPKLLRSAGSGRKFLITSRSDVLLSAGHKLADELAPYTVAIEIEDYGDDRLARIYDGISSDLSGHALGLARTHRATALKTLTRPYEIDRFLVALTREDPGKPRRIDEILAESQINAISRVIADQITAWDDGVASAAIIWAMLSARGAIAVDVLPKLVRRLRAVDPSLRPDVDGLVDFLVAGRNLRQDGAALAFYHPRVEDGLRMAMLHRKGEAEHVLSKLADALAAWDLPEDDWGVETVVRTLRALAKLGDMELALADATHSRLDAYLEAAADNAKRQYDFERAFAELAQHGSTGHAPSRLARLLIKTESETENSFWVTWHLPTVDAEEMAALRNDPRTQRMLERFIRDILPFSQTHYETSIVAVLTQLGTGLIDAFSDALATITTLDQPAQNIDAVVAGALTGDVPDFDGLIDRIAEAEAEVDAWMDRDFRADARRAEEHEVDAAHADHILEEPENRYCNPRECMKAAVRLRREREGFDWIASNPHRQLVVYAWAEIISGSQVEPSSDELRLLLGSADGWTRGRTWSTAVQHWDASLNDLLESELARTDLEDDGLRQTLVEIAAMTGGSGGDPIAVLVRIAPATSTERRLELVLDVMAARFPGGRSASDAGTPRALASRLADTYIGTEAELARTLAEALAGGELGGLAKALSDEARSLLSRTLPRAPASIARPLVCLAASVGIDTIPTAERLLATDDVEDGMSAVQALVIDGSPAAEAALRGALRHGRYPVRRAALTALVDVAGPEDRTALLSAADDRSADVRLAWADLMRQRRWREAVDSLVMLLGDRRDFGIDQAHRAAPSWSQFRVARAAAKALGAYDALPVTAIDALLAAAADSRTKDPFVACAALSALASQDDDRVLPALLSGLLSAGLAGASRYRPLAQAASWALFDRAVAGKLSLDDPRLAQAASAGRFEVAGPLLIAFGIVGGPVRESLLPSLTSPSQSARLELVFVAAAAANTLPGEGTPRIYQMLARLSAGDSVESLDSADRDELTAWSQSLDPAADVQRYSVWLTSIAFKLPVRERVDEPRAFHLPKRIGVLTTRSLSPAREEYSGPDDGT